MKKCREIQTQTEEIEMVNNKITPLMAAQDILFQPEESTEATDELTVSDRKTKPDN